MFLCVTLQDHGFDEDEEAEPRSKGWGSRPRPWEILYSESLSVKVQCLDRLEVLDPTLSCAAFSKP